MRACPNVFGPSDVKWSKRRLSFWRIHGLAVCWGGEEFEHVAVLETRDGEATGTRSRRRRRWCSLLVWFSPVLFLKTWLRQHRQPTPAIACVQVPHRHSLPRRDSRHHHHRRRNRQRQNHSNSSGHLPPNSNSNSNSYSHDSQFALHFSTWKKQVGPPGADSLLVLNLDDLLFRLLLFIITAKCFFNSSFT